MSHRDDPSDPGRRLEAVNTPGLEERVQTRLAEELRWYDARARNNQRWYRAIKVVQLVAAALVPVMAGIGASAWITGGLGSAIVVLEGVQQLVSVPGDTGSRIAPPGRGCAASSTCTRPAPVTTPPPSAHRPCLPNALKSWSPGSMPVGVGPGSSRPRAGAASRELSAPHLWYGCLLPSQHDGAAVSGRWKPPGPPSARGHDTCQLHAMAPGLVGQTIERARRLKRFACSGDMIGPVLAAWPDETNRLPPQRPRSARPPGLRTRPHAGRGAVCRRPLPSRGRPPARRRPPERQPLARPLAAGGLDALAQPRPHRAGPAPVDAQQLAAIDQALRQGARATASTPTTGPWPASPP